MANRLHNATSPYLLQHADNPVDWWPWGEGAFAEARRREMPVLLSIGYSACHWCHVMAHESFEDAETAAYLNEQFVNIKVDREERPDVDAVYMEATQAMTGQGGWPMTCFLTPEGEPFYCGTYFPKQPMQGLPSFGQLTEAVAETWQTRRGEARQAAVEVVRRLTPDPASAPAGAVPDAAALDAAVQTLAGEFDADNGGFGSAPKFPPSLVVEFLLRNLARTGSDTARAMVEGTCEAMARGGVYDQLAGGFARYSVDQHWVVPHFEKMLYDNALLLRGYLHWWRLDGSPLARRIAAETADFLLAEMRTPQGGFASALDADSEGEEGRYYVWTPSQLREVLGDDDGAYAARLFGVTDTGTFEKSSSTLQLRADPTDPERYTKVRTLLLDARSRRVRPGRDDKVVAAWNGLTITALAETGALLEQPEYVDAARTAAELVLGTHGYDAGDERRLVRTSREGVAGASAGVLEDYACMAEACLTLLAVTGESRWLHEAERLLDVVLERFGDRHGGFFDTADDAEELVQRPHDPMDNVTPSGRSAAASALVSYAAITGSTRHREAAEGALSYASLLADRAPRAGGWTLAVAEALLAGPLEIAVVARADELVGHALHQTALASPSPGAVVVAGEPAGSSAGQAEVPLLAERGLVDGAPAVYVCRGFVCDRPVTTVADLRAKIGAEGAIGTDG